MSQPLKENLFKYFIKIQQAPPPLLQYLITAWMLFIVLIYFAMITPAVESFSSLLLRINKFMYDYFSAPWQG